MQRTSGQPRLVQRVLAVISGSVIVLGAAIGCSVTVDGNARYSSAEVTSYKVEVSASRVSASAAAAAQEEERKQELARQGLRNFCGVVAEENKRASDAYGPYIDTFNAGGNADALSGPAIDALRNAALAVEGTITATLAPEVTVRARDYMNVVRRVADVIASKAPLAEFNQAIQAWNGTSDGLFGVCAG
ncbi:MAG: hypothetical protein ACRCSF_09665 [Mycobacteriaceae bacterium]